MPRAAAPLCLAHRLHNAHAEGEEDGDRDWAAGALFSLPAAAGGSGGGGGDSGREEGGSGGDGGGGGEAGGDGGGDLGGAQPREEEADDGEAAEGAPSWDGGASVVDAGVLDSAARAGEAEVRRQMQEEEQRRRVRYANVPLPTAAQMAAMEQRQREAVQEREERNAFMARHG